MRWVAGEESQKSWCIVQIDREQGESLTRSLGNFQLDTPNKIQVQAALH